MTDLPSDNDDGPSFEIGWDSDEHGIVMGISAFCNDGVDQFVVDNKDPEIAEALASQLTLIAHAMREKKDTDWLTNQIAALPQISRVDHVDIKRICETCQKEFST